MNGGAISLDTSQKYTGTQSLKVTPSQAGKTADTGMIFRADSPRLMTDYVASFWLFSTIDRTINARGYSDAWGSVASSAITIKANTWTPVEFTWTTNDKGAGNTGVALMTNGTTGDDLLPFWVDHVAIQVGNMATDAGVNPNEKANVVDVPTKDSVPTIDSLAPNLIDVATDDWITLTNTYNGGWRPVSVVKGTQYALQVEVDSTVGTTQAYVICSSTDPASKVTQLNGGKYVPTGTTGTSQEVFTASATGTLWFGVAVQVATSKVAYRHLELTETKSGVYIDYDTAQFNRHGYGLDKVQDSIGGRNLLTGTSNDLIILAGGGTANWNFEDLYKELVPGTTYTFSSELTLTGSTDNVASIRVLPASEQGEALVAMDSFPADGKRHYWTFTCPPLMVLIF